MNLQFDIRIILTLSFLALLSACGQSSSPSDTLDLGSSDLPTEMPLVTCNKAMTSTLGYKTAAQILGTGYDPNWSNLYLSNLPNGFEAGTSYVQFYKGQANGDANIAYSSTPLTFAIFNTSTAQYLKDSSGNILGFTSFTWSSVKDLIPGTTPATFVGKVIFVLSLQDPSSLYQVLSVRSYNTAGSVLLESLPTLLPTFYANPADYAKKADGSPRESILKNMHPLKNQVGDYATLAHNLCL